MALHNPYQVLGIHPTADDEEIKRAYRRLAKQFHPDRNPDSRHSEDRFKEISRAYQVLRDPKKRADFDRKGFRPPTAQTAGPSPFDSDWDLSDIFDNFFSDLHQQNRPDYRPRSERGKDIKFHATVTLEEVVRGTICPIQVTRMVGCPQCQGNGTTTHSEPQACVVCGGRGHVRRKHGFLDIKAPCVACGGTGEVVLDACKHCGGTGRIGNEKTLNVRIPPGAEDGTRLKVAAEGNAGIRGGGPGDLLVTVGIRPHEHFRKDGIDIHHTLSVNMVQATLGGDFSIPTLDGTTRLKLPAGTQSGTTFRLHGKGLPKPNGKSRGDQLVQVRVETPTRLSRRQRELLKEFEDSAEGTTPDVEAAQRDGGSPFSGALFGLKQWWGKFQKKSG